jgi:hypothetical protein
MWQAIGESGNTLSDILKENVKKDATIIVHAGTEIGLLFVESVYGKDSAKK